MTGHSHGRRYRDYLEHIDATLEPFGGRFLAHGSRPIALETISVIGAVIIEFETHVPAELGYRSPAYQAIVQLRTTNTDGVAVLVH